MAGKIEKATHQDATDYEGPVDTGNPHAKRPADKKGVGDKEFDNSANTDKGKVFSSGKVNEAEIKALFDGVEGLSEDFTSRATVLIEGALSEKIELIREEVEAEYNTKLEEALQEVAESYEDKLDAYLDYVVENFMKENEVAIDLGIKNDIAEQVMESVVSIVEAQGVTLPEDQVNIAEALAEDLKTSESQLNRVIEENIELKEELEKAYIKEALAEMSSDLSDGKKEKLARLSENISFEDVEDFKTKVTILKESLTGISAKSEETVDELNEQVDTVAESGKKALTERQREYLQALRGGE